MESDRGTERERERGREIDREGKRVFIFVHTIRCRHAKNPPLPGIDAVRFKIYIREFSDSRPGNLRAPNFLGFSDVLSDENAIRFTLSDVENCQFLGFSGVNRTASMSPLRDQLNKVISPLNSFQLDEEEVYRYACSHTHPRR